MPTSGKGPPDSTDHYARLAGSYSLLWDHTPQFRTWMVEQILDIATPPASPLVADVGGGTGIFAAELLRQRHDEALIYLIDPSAEMLSRAPAHPRLRTVCAAAENSRQTLTDLGVTHVDLLLIKEAVHHFLDPAATLQDLSHLVAPQRSLLVVMLPTHIEYPLFAVALQRFTELQPDPADIAAYLSAAGLVTTRQTRGFTLDRPKEQWLKLVANRFMSLLSTFSDDEITQGMSEIEQNLADTDSVRFCDNFEFVLGRKPAP
jgi:2-polyprenyl-3-methyl-5-hydroxy-6-metoxy-1,4-benzoquinol methylase